MRQQFEAQRGDGAQRGRRCEAVRIATGLETGSEDRAVVELLHRCAAIGLRALDVEDVPLAEVAERGVGCVERGVIATGLVDLRREGFGGFGLRCWLGFRLGFWLGFRLRFGLGLGCGGRGRGRLGRLRRRLRGLIRITGVGVAIARRRCSAVAAGCVRSLCSRHGWSVAVSRSVRFIIAAEHHDRDDDHADERGRGDDGEPHIRHRRLLARLRGGNAAATRAGGAARARASGARSHARGARRCRGRAASAARSGFERARGFGDPHRLRQRTGRIVRHVFDRLLKILDQLVVRAIAIP